MESDQGTTLSKWFTLTQARVPHLHPDLTDLARVQSEARTVGWLSCSCPCETLPCDCQERVCLGVRFHTFHTLPLTSAEAKHLSSLRPTTPLAESEPNWQARMELPQLGLGGGGWARLGGGRWARSLLLPMLLLAAHLSKVAIAAVPANVSNR